MKQVTARFTLTSVTEEATPTPCYAGNNGEGQPTYKDVTGLQVSMHPVTAAGAQAGEDAAFAAATPSGQLFMRVMNEAIRTSGFFEAGAKYRVTIERDEDVAPPAPEAIAKPKPEAPKPKAEAKDAHKAE